MVVAAPILLLLSAPGPEADDGYPAESDVRAGVVYGASIEFTGTLELPAESNVADGVGYGAGGTEFTGTLTGGGGGSVGAGESPIDHDGGDGVTVDGAASENDCLRYVDPDGAGVPSLFVRAYLASDYNASPPVRVALGTTTTGSDGRWAAPLMLDAGTYRVVADRSGDGFLPQVNEIVVP